MSHEPADRVRQRAALVAATLASFLTPFLGSSINVALPSIGADLRMTAIQLSWVATAFLLASAVCLVPFGRLADRIGRKRVFVVGIAVFTAATIACALAGSAAMLIACRAIQGIGAAMIFGTGVAILTAAFPKEQRGRVLGINASSVYIGLSAGPFAGGLLTRHIGWPSVFWVTVPAGLLAGVVAAQWLPRDAITAHRAKSDIVGTLLYAFMLLSLMSGLSALPSVGGAMLIGAGLVGSGIFVVWEQHTEDPVFDLPLLGSNPVFAWSNLAALVNYSSTSAVAFLISLHLQYVRGFNAAEAGMTLLTQSVIMAATSPFAGRLSDKVEPRIVSSLGMALTMVALFWLACLGATTPLPVLLGALVVLGAGFGLFASPNTNAVMTSVSPPQYGVAAATLGTMRLLGQTVSMGFAAAVLAMEIGHSSITPEHHAGFLLAMRIVLVASGVLCSFGVFASLARGNVHSPDARLPVSNCGR